ncbi:5,10-methenyltetrahydrofolate synthetase [Caulobacter sp. AP07]|uniref:5-formyltetrahydrofolate cyclo-ligase n=1 Tax=Caulobacter sp. AP07 TaxID=1144304 RepID=UPI000271EE5B|nr:5-formyltetrahydrofolate cyclo-ligase [Caulobacter sp. AP07]EJL23387.1 5,10-methenyltetrahydrofolate synthetase [Caulobacter sp. AP07]
MVHADPATAKTALRMLVRNRRRQLAREHPQADWRLVDAGRAPLGARFPDPAGKVAALYVGLGSEIDPRHLGDWLVEQGWSLALPRAEDAQGAMVFRRWTPGQPLARDEIGLSSPDVSSPAVEPDLVVVPLLAFDRDGRRLGQGGGYYDRALEALRSRRAVFALGLAYAGQETHGLPVEPHDQRLDAILTESEYIAVQKD